MEKQTNCPNLNFSLQRELVFVQICNLRRAEQTNKSFTNVQVNHSITSKHTFVFIYI